ncbi:iron-sulfur protein [Catellatospora sp. TT07R-123]|uniref:Rieske (2Fe-2S) protein n=1 Tax=Catellatospora sp. TT07R-123 TaxID=2733863 RepID=UPI001B2CE0F1|nr:Rieske (2Fe-2S) protein [Catellatospora sp. TT07R-123]GHJ44841.1 iron-sulfur protein [Catellatospora sp. TT07R-123]
MSDALQPATSRRTLLAGAGMAGAAGLLAACGTDEPAATPNNGSGGGPSGGTGAQAPASGTVLGKTADIPVGGGKIFAEHGTVVTQPSPNIFVGFSSICTHQSCPVSQIADGKIKCTCHFSEFNIGDGAPAKVDQPAKRALDERKIVVEGDEVRIA